MKYNKSEIMRRAWELKRNNIRLVGRVPSNYNKSGFRSFGECLRQAWAEAKRAIKTAKREAAKVVAEAKKVYRGYVSIISTDGNITVDTLFGRVYGKTYGWRKTLKNWGAAYCPEDKEWALPIDRVQDFCRAYA